MCNFVTQFTQLNRELFQNVNKKGNSCIETIFKGRIRRTIQNSIERTKKIQNWAVSLILDTTAINNE